MKLEIGNRVIVLTGPGGAAGRGPTMEEIKTVRRRFRRLFGVDPAITIRGKFARDSMMAKDATDASGPDIWPLTNNPEPVIFVGADYIKIRFTFPQWKGRESLRVNPERGSGVQVRFSLPNG